LDAARKIVHLFCKPDSRSNDAITGSEIDKRYNRAEGYGNGEEGIAVHKGTMKTMTDHAVQLFKKMTLK